MLQSAKELPATFPIQNTIIFYEILQPHQKLVSHTVKKISIVKMIKGTHVFPNIKIENTFDTSYETLFQDSVEP